MTPPLPAELAEQIEALRQELARPPMLTWVEACRAIDRTLALCAEAWGRRDAERHDGDVATIRALAACQTKVNAQAARIEALETTIGGIAKQHLSEEMDATDGNCCVALAHAVLQEK